MSPNAVALRSAVNRRDVTESSFAFQVTNEEWNADYSCRQIYAVDLHGGDVSPVNNAANSRTGDAGNEASFRAMVSGNICTCCAMCAQDQCDGTCCNACALGDVGNADAASGLQNELPMTTHSKFEEYDYRIRLAKIAAGVPDP